MQGGKIQAKWTQLSRELWSRILALAQPDNDPRSAYCLSPFRADVQQFYELRLVCKLFDSIFREHPYFESILCLRDDLGVDNLSGLLHWMTKHGISTQTLVPSSGSSFTEAALTALYYQQCQNSSSALETFCAIAPEEHMSDRALLLLQPLSTLISCTLNLGGGRQSPAFSLKALKSLSFLTNLCLSAGNFVEIDSAQHLTHLNISHSKAVCYASPPCVTSLIELEVSSSVVDTFHQKGVFACTKLEVLVCAKSCIQASDKQCLLWG